MKILIQRIYDDIPHKGYRVLVDRLWPRGVSKEAAALDEWCREIAPSASLRKWFNHEAGKWPEFRKRYLHELKDGKETARALLAKAAKKKSPLLLLYGAKSTNHNHALVLKEYLETLLDEDEPRQFSSSPCFAHGLRDAEQNE